MFQSRSRRFGSQNQIACKTPEAGSASNGLGASDRFKILGCGIPCRPSEVGLLTGAGAAAPKKHLTLLVSYFVGIKTK